MNDAHLRCMSLYLYCRGIYDNLANHLANPDLDARVTWGDQTWEEMMIGYFDVVLPRGENVGSRWGADQPRNHSTPQRLAQLFTTWDQNGDGTLQRDEAPMRLRGAFDRIDQTGRSEITLEQLQYYHRRRQSSER